MIDIVASGRLASSPCEEEDDAELRFVFVGRWQHFFDGRPTWSDTRWVFDRTEWSVVFLEVLDPAGDCRLRQPHVLGRLAQRMGADHGDERGDVIDLQVRGHAKGE